MKAVCSTPAHQVQASTSTSRRDVGNGFMGCSAWLRLVQCQPTRNHPPCQFPNHPTVVDEWGQLGSGVEGDGEMQSGKDNGDGEKQ